MNHLWGALCLVACSLPCFAADECRIPEISAPDAIEIYIRHAVPNGTTLACVEEAYDRLAALPSDSQIPIYLRLLGIQAPAPPPESGDAIPIGGTPQNLTFGYPAAEGLEVLGARSTGPLLEYIQSNPLRDTVAWKNAVLAFTQVQLRFGVAHVVTALKTRRAGVKDSSQSDRLSAAIRFVVDTYCRNERGTACIAAAESQ